MSKIRKKFVCANCSQSYVAWQGRCDSCQEWSTIKEQVTTEVNKLGIRSSVSISKLKSFENHHVDRIPTGFGEFDSVLGGGLVRGSLLLIGGEPGIGKSTISLQVLINLCKAGKRTLYVTGEESGSQLRGRAERIDSSADFDVYCDNTLENVVSVIKDTAPDFVIIDSIQTMYSQEISGVGGGVAQIAHATNQFMVLAKNLNVTILLIGHVTKDGNLAGPKTLEHMVDAVLYLEGERNGQMKILKSAKNRFGSTGEVGVFEMDGEGMKEVLDPSSRFLSSRQLDLSGVCRFPSIEGNRVIMMEIEALTNPIAFGYPRRVSLGFDQARLNSLCAILQKRLGLKLDGHDVYLNVAGGFELDEKEADLPAALAIISSYYNVVLSKDFCASGEISLSGEIRQSKLIEKRIKECEKLKFKELAVSIPDQKINSKIKIQNILRVSEIQKILKG